MVNLGGDDLCQQCAQSLRQLIDAHHNTIAVQYNDLLDMVDAGVEIPTGMPRMPVTRPAAATVQPNDVRYKHIDTANADVAAINQEGQIDRIDLAMESFAQRGGEKAKLAKHTEGFVNAVLAADELPVEDKRALTHVVSTLVTQVETSEPKRLPRSVLQSIFETVSPLLRGRTALVRSWDELDPKLAEPLKLAHG